jgi:penicillin-binding protein 1A
MRSCYELEDLNISKEEFLAPEELTIEVDCETTNEEGEVIPKDNTTITPDFDF